MLLDEVLVGELGAVDGLASGAVGGGEVTVLAHEVWDDAVEAEREREREGGGRRLEVRERE